MKSKSNSRNGSAMSAYSSASIRLDPNAMIRHSELLQNYISSKSIYDLQEKSDHEIQRSKSKVDAILNRERTIVKDVVDPMMIDQFINDRRKKEVLNKKWNRAVFEPVYDKITRSIENGDMDMLRERKRELHQNYLDYVNKKDFVSLSEYCADEYYPFALQSPKIQMQLPRTGPPITSEAISRSKSAGFISNPTSIDEYQRLEEDNCQIRCLTGYNMNRSGLLDLRLPRSPLKPLGRQGTDCITWAYLPYYQINSDIRSKCRRKIRGNFNHSSAQLCFMPSYDTADMNRNLRERVNTAV